MGCVRSIRAMPRRSAIAVLAILTREFDVLGPHDRNLQGAQSRALREDEQLCVEEPTLVSHRRQQLASNPCTYGFETALRIAHSQAQDGAKQEVVATRDAFTLEAARDSRAGQKPAADHDVGTTAEERFDQRPQRPEVGREVDVHVRDDVGVACEPRCAQRPSASLLVDAHKPNTIELALQTPADRGCGVIARVVDDRDARGPWQLRADVCVQRAHARLQVALLVEHGDRDVDRRLRCLMHASSVGSAAVRTPRGRWGCAGDPRHGDA